MLRFAPLSLCLFLAACAEQAASDALSVPHPPHSPTIRWLATPDAAALDRAYPPRARDLGLGGRAGLACVTQADGGLNRCRVVDEAPEGFGFGDAVLSLAPRFKAAIPLAEGQEVRVGAAFLIGERHAAAGFCEALQLALDPAFGRAEIAASIHRRAPLIVPSPEDAERRLERHMPLARLLVDEQPASAARLAKPCSAAPHAVDLARAYPTPVTGWIDSTGKAHAVKLADWAGLPSGVALWNLYPETASRAGLQGRAVLQCRLGLDGVPRDCAVIEESPVGWGFGEATLQVAPHTRFFPETVDGSPIESIVQLPMNWRLPN
jgi:TonB family protein